MSRRRLALVPRPPLFGAFGCPAAAQPLGAKAPPTRDWRQCSPVGGAYALRSPFGPAFGHCSAAGETVVEAM
jgi:hypothetical protein